MVTTGDDVQHLLSDLGQKKFFGTLELKYEGGKVVLVRKTETIKLIANYRDSRGSSNEHE